VRDRTRDFAVVALLAVAASTLSWVNSGRVAAALDVRGPSPGGYDDIWFDADTRDLHRHLTFDNYQQTHTVRHPLLALIGRLPLRVYLRAVGDADRVDVIRGALALMAASWAGLLFVTLRLIGLRRLDGLVFASIGILSAASVFWFAAPETFALGAITILPAVALVAIADRRGVPEWAAAGVAALTLSVTVTNGMCGAIAAWITQPRRRFVQIMSNAVCIVLLLWGVQRFIYPASGYPYAFEFRSYRGFFFSADMKTPVAPAAVFLLNGVVMPQIEVIHRATQDNYPVLSVQGAAFGSMTALRAIALAAWIGILAAGLWSAAAGYASRRLRTMLLWSLAGQLALHMAFGDETFLFAMHFVPLLVIAAALGALAPWRRTVIAGAVVLLVALAAQNLLQLANAVELARQITSRMPS
jgi:hypothetical protein